MIRRLSLLPVLTLLALALVFAPSARSQVVVYSVDFKHEDGFNIDFFNGGYFVAPALGGTGTFVLTSIDNGTKTLTSSAGTGNFFHGIDEHEKRFSVVSATGGDGSTSVASYVAFGEVNSTVELVTTDATYKLKLAKKLKGTSVAASSAENTVTSSSSSTTDATTGTTTTTTTTTTGTTDTTGTSTGTSTSTTVSDGTVGFANVSSLTLTYDEAHTKQSNKLDQSVEQAVASLAVELQQKGYVDSGSSSSSSSTSSSSTSSSSSSSNSTTTTAVPEIGVSVSNAGGVVDGGSAAFGSVATGSTLSLTFTISNTGGADLTGLTTTIDGTNASDFTVTSAATAPVTGPIGSTTLTIQFKPSAAGARTAALHIANNDSDENPYDITLTGTGT